MLRVWHCKRSTRMPSLRCRMFSASTVGAWSFPKLVFGISGEIVQVVCERYGIEWRGDGVVEVTLSHETVNGQHQSSSVVTIAVLKVTNLPTQGLLFVPRDTSGARPL